MPFAPLIAAVLSAGPPATARLSYEVAPGLAACPDERWLRAAVAARLGRDPFTPAAGTLVRARVEARTPPALEAQVEVARADGTVGRRTLESPTGDCLELASAVELAITLALEPRRFARPPASAPPAPTTSPAPPAARPPKATLPPVELLGRVGLLGTAGGVPGFSGGLLLGGGVTWRRFSLSLEGRAHLPSGVDYGSGRVSTFSALASLVPCLRAGGLSGCAVVSVGALQVERPGGEVFRTTTVMAQAGARVSYTFDLGRGLNLGPWLEGAVVLTRTSIVTGASSLWVTWPVALSGGVLLELQVSS
ncbi:MAG: hypothetical protein INH41_20360 [Myxococcaceae bacterium]|jgi:hypothetical protein|nr:hypothetical protein [Myxococcaceae bacterium]